MTTANAPEQSAIPTGGLLARYPLTSFFVMAFAFSWIAWSPWFLSEDGIGLLPYSNPLINGLVVPVGILVGPFLSAFIMTGATEGKAGIRRLLRRFVLWRVGLQWYLFAPIGVPLAMGLGTVIVPGGLASLLALGPGYVPKYLVWFLIITIIGGPLLEEPGWRGFALPRLQQLHGPLVGTLILGLLWALWHLPEFLVPAWAKSSGGSGFLDIVKFVVIAIAFAIVITWVFNNTRGSLLMAILVHASIDTFTMPMGTLFPPFEMANSILVSFGALALVIVVLTRCRLGYRHYQQEEEPDPATAPN
jgi:membrane protease YdiL (CAAX protease family)